MPRVVEKVHSAEFCSAPSFATGRKTSRGAKGKGNRYEKLLGEKLNKIFGSANVKLGPWIKFKISPDGKDLYCQPDAIITLPSGGKAIIEAKLTQTLQGQAQLKLLYFPTVSFIFPGKKIWLVNIYKNIVLPSRWELSSLSDIPTCPHSEILDYQFIPR